jgi:hypothetical protein
MNRTVVGVAIGVAVVGSIVYLAMGQFGAKCNVCMNFDGRTVCETALAAERSEAQSQATSSACARLTRGVTDVVACTRMVPRSVQCEE